MALVATGLGALGVPVLLGASMATVAGIASVAAAASNIGASLLQKPPPARGNVTQVLIAPDAPQPYVMGEGYFAGVRRHDVAYGATLNKVPNPYRWMVDVYSGGGPVQSITPYVDKLAVDAWYSGYLQTDTQLGATPEGGALVPPYGAATGWGAGSKLSGQAAIGWNLKFDKEGKRFASGVPQLGAYGQWVKVYDPRLDSTFPGGVGAHRVNNEATWAWSENPALHAGVYAYGRYQNGKRTFGVGLSTDAIDWACIAAWANVCEANAWTIFGVIYEPGNRWANLKDIAAAGGAQPVASSGGLLSFKYAAPQVALDTITRDDLAEDPVRITAMQSWGERVNTIVPRYISPDHEWQQVAAEAGSVPAYVTEDGEEKVREWPWNLVKGLDQVTQLAAYVLVDGREITPIVLHCLPRLRAYRPGECLTLDLPDEGLETDAIILQRQFDPATMTVTLTLVGETAAKHAYALGLTGVAPPTPALGQDGEQRDTVIAGAGGTDTYVVADEAALLALAVPEGTVAKRTDNGTSYIRNSGTSGTITDWTVIGTATSAYTDEMAQDAIGGILTDTATIDFTYSDATPSITADVKTGSISLAMQADMATASLVYRKTAGAGAPEVNTLATLKTDLGLTGTNSGDQTSIVGLAGTKAQFNTAVSDGDIVYTDAIGVSVQAYDLDLATIAGLTATTDNFIVSVASAWASRTPAQVRTTLGLVIGTNVQAYDADLATWAGITPGTGVGTALAVNVGSAGAFVAFNGALGTPSSGTLTNATGLPIAGLVASTVTALGVGSVELGHATDTTLARSSAGNVTIEGNLIYRAGGTDVPLADGGTGASLVDPNADRILFWDDSAGAMTWLTLGTNLTITGTTIDAAGGGGYTDEQAQDAVGAMVDTSLVYVDATPLLTRAALTGDATASQGSNAVTVVKINGIALSGLATGILKNTTATGAPSIAAAGDFPTLNQNTTGSAATLTTPRTISITGKATAAGGTFNGSAALAINVTALTVDGAITPTSVVGSAGATFAGLTPSYNGINLEYNTGTAYLLAYASGAFKPLSIQGSSIGFNIGGTDVLAVSGTAVSITGTLSTTGGFTTTLPVAIPVADGTARYLGLTVKRTGGATSATYAGRAVLVAFGDENNPTLTGAVGGYRKDPSVDYAGGLKFYVNGASATSTAAGLTEAAQLSATDFKPGTDNTLDLGTAALRWKVVYAGTGTINTSDGREKRDFGPIPDIWLDAWGDVEWHRFKYEGGQRWHVGLVAQQVHAAFAGHGVDAFEIGLCCYDKWDDEWEAETIEEERPVTERVLELVPRPEKGPGSRSNRFRWVELPLMDMVPERVGTDEDGTTPLFRQVARPKMERVPVPTGKRRLVRTSGDRWGLRYDECQAIEAAWGRREMNRLRAV